MTASIRCPHCLQIAVEQEAVRKRLAEILTRPSEQLNRTSGNVCTTNIAIRGGNSGNHVDWIHRLVLCIRFLRCYAAPLPNGSRNLKALALRVYWYFALDFAVCHHRVLTYILSYCCGYRPLALLRYNSKLTTVSKPRAYLIN